MFYNFLQSEVDTQWQCLFKKLGNSRWIALESKETKIPDMVWKIKKMYFQISHVFSCWFLNKINFMMKYTNLQPCLVLEILENSRRLETHLRSWAASLALASALADMNSRYNRSIWSRECISFDDKNLRAF